MYREMTPEVDLSIRINRRHVAPRIDEPIVVVRRTVGAAFTRVGQHLDDVTIRETNPREREPVALPEDDVLAGILDQQSGAFAAEQPRHAFRHLEGAIG